MDAELKKEIANRLDWYSRYIERDQEEQAVKSFDGIVQLIQQEIAKARIEAVMYVDSMLRFENIPLHPVQVNSLKEYIKQLEPQTLKEHKEE